MIKLDGKEVKVGSKLFCLINGWGVVVDLDYEDTYPIEVSFPGSVEYYTEKGAFDVGLERSLFWEEPKDTPEQDLNEKATYLVLSMAHVDESEITMPNPFILARSDSHIFVNLPGDDFAMYYTCKDAPRSLIAPILYAYNKGFDMLVLERGEDLNEELPVYNSAEAFKSLTEQAQNLKMGY